MNNTRIIRANHDSQTITVYQAFNEEIALSAVEAQTFVSPSFKKGRMTWIKPSFLWMMYRSGWGQKENQGNILAIKITHEGFLWALENSCISHYIQEIYQSKELWKKKKEISPVRIQWDPERDIHFTALNQKSIQIGLSENAVDKYTNEWIVSIENLTPLTKKLYHLYQSRKFDELIKLLPKENYFHIERSTAFKINASY